MNPLTHLVLGVLVEAATGRHLDELVGGAATDDGRRDARLPQRTGADADAFLRFPRQPVPRVRVR